MDKRPDIEQTQNTWPEIDTMIWINTYTNNPNSIQFSCYSNYAFQLWGGIIPQR